MSRAQPPSDPSGPEGPDRPPSWMGAPGYSPYRDDLPPHAPMPGAPPYPAAQEHPPPPVGRPAAHTGILAALGAAAVWAGVNVVLVLVVAGAPAAGSDVARLVGALLVPTLIAALVVWLVARHRAWSFWLLVLAAAPVFWVLRALSTLFGV
ncbi:hypothetical protein [Pseudonocardia xinjiangensis]|uniref:Uncharacterized protein n=1 Tax=Pseudonocardia xinjiangensis TaxID=75289 RepID=A0ABX1RNM4_9PSEU|nr:hypothetical protein [Pseudonocardia xinjiangensis]NMH81474.1 hypothetical protein [Pseudonocardia xinjiangensis]